MKKILYLLSFLLYFNNAFSQDPIFTQYFFLPETLNPAFTGFMETTYLGVIHRTQWPSLDLRVDTDYAFASTWKERMNSGIGIAIFNSRENVTNYSLTQFNLSYCYRVQLNDDWNLRLAVEGGLGLKNFAFDNLVLSDQININTGTINNSSIDPALENDKIYYPDFSAGVLYHSENAWIGISAKHLNRPNIAFTAQENVPLEIFYSVNAGYEFLLARFIDVQLFPYETKMMLSANFMQQGEYNRLDFGTAFLFKRLLLGATFATNPARNDSNSHLLTSINAFTGFQLDGFRLGLSYDFNTSKIGRTGGVYEVSLTYQFDLDIKCFGCPNYTGSN
ncbi:MAG: PorP/SprF family type IX secretion system membrane protein [Flavobacteriaceae bacterium]